MFAAAQSNVGYGPFPDCCTAIRRKTAVRRSLQNSFLTRIRHIGGIAPPIKGADATDEHGHDVAKTMRDSKVCNADEPVNS